MEDFADRQYGALARLPVRRALAFTCTPQESTVYVQLTSRSAADHAHALGTRIM